MLVSRLLDLVFPPRCPACDARTPAPLCEPCSQSLMPLDAACPICAEPIAGTTAHLCRRCAHAPLPLRRTTAPYQFGGELATALRRLKYARRPDIARTLAPLLAPTLAAAAATADLVVPVPLHWRRHARRGFNQAALLASEAGARPNPHLLLRTRPTPPQAGLSSAARRANVHGAFAVPRRQVPRVSGHHVLLVDDVVTTGATAGAAARALLDAGAASVSCVCLARAE